MQNNSNIPTTSRRWIYRGLLVFSVCATAATAPDSSTLPRQLNYQQYSQYIAQELHWMQGGSPTAMCPGSFHVPDYLKKHPLIDENAPVEITAEGPETLRLKGASILTGNVTVTQPGRIIKADRITLLRSATTGKITQITLSGHVRFYQENSLMVSDDANITLYPKNANLQRVAYHYFKPPSKTSTSTARFDAWGTAEHASENAQHVLTMEHATYTYCPPISPAWSLSARKLVIDKEHNVGKAYNGVLRVKNIPVFFWPYYSFQLNNERKSGFLMPEFGSLGRDSLGNDAGFLFSIPYYLNLAPNYDLVISLQSYGSHGFRGVGKFRYISQRTDGEISLSYLPDDTEFAAFRTEALKTYGNPLLYNPLQYQPYLDQLSGEGSQRGEVNAVNHFHFNSQWSGRWFVNWVSDPYYLVDTAALRGGALSTTNELLNLIQFDYNTMHWQSSFSSQAFQSLYLITQVQKNSQNLSQYTRLPDLNTIGYYGMTPNSDFIVEADYTNFLYASAFSPQEPQGSRLHLRPGLMLDYESSGAYLKPNIWVDAVGYQLSDTTPGMAETQQRTLPIVNLDGGLRLVHDYTFHDTDLTQTLEPRLFYLYIPYQNQNSLPNFDTIFLPYYWDQLYSLNTFQGVDRLENANQLTVGLSSSTIRNSNAQTLFSAGLGAIYYIDSPKVCLTADCVLQHRNVSPLVANLSFNPDGYWSLSTNFAWDPKIKQTNNFVSTFGYRGDGRHLAGLSYAFVNGSAGSISPFSAVAYQPDTQNARNTSYLGSYFAWPLTYKWTALGNTYLDFEQRRLIALFTGVEYDSCCWSMRLIYNRSFNDVQLSNTGSPNNSWNNSYYIQITLKGLGSIGTRPESFVQSIVPGYQSNYWEKP